MMNSSYESFVQAALSAFLTQSGCFTKSLFDMGSIC